jgi:ribosome-associated translation inhibitor RaiA
MMIQINSDSHVSVNPHLAHYIEEQVQHSLARFGGQLTRVEIHLSDENGQKSGAADKKCRIEARAAGYPPMAVSSDAKNMQQAVVVAAGKMKRLMENSFGRLSNKRSGESVRYGVDAAYEGMDS